MGEVLIFGIVMESQRCCNSPSVLTRLRHGPHYTRNGPAHTTDSCRRIR